jgi:predicted nucleic acid-binding Zn ribbon protein
MIIEYKCECSEGKIEVMYKRPDEVKEKVKCKKCGKMAKKVFPLANFVMKTGGTRNKK